MQARQRKPVQVGTPLVNVEPKMTVGRASAAGVAGEACQRERNRWKVLTQRLHRIARWWSRRESPQKARLWSMAITRVMTQGASIGHEENQGEDEDRPT